MTFTITRPRVHINGLSPASKPLHPASREMAKEVLSTVYRIKFPE